MIICSIESFNYEIVTYTVFWHVNEPDKVNVKSSCEEGEHGRVCVVLMEQQCIFSHGVVPDAGKEVREGGSNSGWILETCIR